MKTKEIKNDLLLIAGKRWDPEYAHIVEDNLYRNFIIHISKRKDKLGKKARLILTSEDIKFPRHAS